MSSILVQVEGPLATTFDGFIPRARHVTGGFTVAVVVDPGVPAPALHRHEAKKRRKVNRWRGGRRTMRVCVETGCELRVVLTTTAVPANGQFMDGYVLPLVG